MARKITSLKNIKNLPARRIMSDTALRKALENKPESYGSSPNTSTKTQFNSYGEIISPIEDRPMFAPRKNERYAPKHVSLNKYGEIDEKPELPRHKEGKLPKRAYSIITIAGIVLGLSLISGKITGNVIGNASNNSFSTLGIILLAIGLIAGLFWVKNRGK